MELHAYLGKECRNLIAHYGLNKRTSLPTVDEISEESDEYISLLAHSLHHIAYHPLLVIIRNFDRPAFNHPDGRAILNPILNRLEEEVKAHVIGSLLLLSSLDDGTVHTCMGRHALTPINEEPCSRQPLDLPRTLDLTHHPAFQTAMGITRAEVNALDDALGHIKPHDPMRVLDMMDKRHGRPSVFADPLPRPHQCPPDPLIDGNWLGREVDPLAALDRSGEHECLCGAVYDGSVCVQVRL
ncbi:hypothetical protein MIND_00268600 [Mycena indigotica]|uniref:Uncharacterized protein n=1 Tax=Mycena indigotica TaxID=2126181 RepID=A0A8H6T8Z6_9AGAR|nr:uncharacterized protein MIND_00268600 [Mycena indigotica]KAF7312547.1 hypothetical protein MIND_00268600 [Mycena indigotica]